jgi:GTP-binding protein
VSAKNNIVRSAKHASEQPSPPLSSVLRHTVFLLGAARVKQFPGDSGWETAVAGRSNAGKSSAINAITGVRGLARISKTPGRTREINFFQIDSERRFVDLPGYGYARVPLPVRQAWARLIEDYFRQRRSLRGVILVMDCRHPLTEFDQQMLMWCDYSRLPVHILLTKADKLSRGAAKAVLHKVRNQLHPHRENEAITVQLFSALKREGIAEAQEILAEWMEFEIKKGPGL